MDTQSETPTETSESVESLTATLSSLQDKFFLRSKTIWGLIILTVLVAAHVMGVDVEAFAEDATAIGGVIGGWLVVLGIRTAKQDLTVRPESSSNDGMDNIVNKSNLLAIALTMGAVVGLACLPSCSHIPEGSSVKFHSGTLGAGVECDDEGCRVHVAPAVDSQK